jgi:hypothetical protein
MKQMNGSDKTRAYEALSQHYDLPDSDSENDDSGMHTDENKSSDVGAVGAHPNPLRLNPPATPLAAQQYKPYRPGRSPAALSEVSLNDRRVSGSRDITDEKQGGSDTGVQPRNRNSSIQPESAFYSKPYGELKAATPPIMIGSNRQVSSGNDYDMGSRYAAFGRRKASAKVAEEGRAGQQRHSRYCAPNE